MNRQTDKIVLCKGFYSLVAEKAETEAFFSQPEQKSAATLSLNPVSCANYVQNEEDKRTQNLSSVLFPFFFF